MRGPEAVDPAGGEEAVPRLVEELLRVVVELAGRGLLEDRREASLQLPGMEEELPVHVPTQRGQIGLDDPRAGELRSLEGVELDLLAVLSRGLDRDERLPVALAMAGRGLLLLLPVLAVERGAALVVQQVGDDADDAGGVEHMDGRVRVDGRDLDRRVLLRGRRASDQERQRHAAPLHLGRDVHHLVERGRDEAGKPDHVAVLLLLCRGCGRPAP